MSERSNTDLREFSPYNMSKQYSLPLDSSKVFTAQTDQDYKQKQNIILEKIVQLEKDLEQFKSSKTLTQEKELESREFY